MTRRDYILLASVLRDLVPKDNPAIRMIADALAQDNPRFNRDHFLAMVRGELPLNVKI